MSIYIKNKILITVLVSSIILSACSPKIVNKTQWQFVPVTIDGSTSEYQDFRFYNKKTKMFYLLSNDNANLYICLKTNDEAMQMKIMHAGMEIWIDTLAKSKEQNGILFPLENENKMDVERMKLSINNEEQNKMNTERIKPPANKEGQKPGILNMKQNFLLRQTFMQLIGFINTTNELISLEDKSGIKVKINWENNNSMIYEAVIPFKTFYKESISNSDSIKIFTLTVNINAIPMPNMPQSGGPGSGGMQGTPPFDNNSMGNMSTMFEKNTFIEKFRIETKKL